MAEAKAIVSRFQEQAKQVNEISAEISKIKGKKISYEELLVKITAKPNTNTKKADLLRRATEKIESLNQEYFTKFEQIRELKAEMERSLPEVNAAIAEMRAARNSRAAGKSSSRRNRKSRSRRTRRRRN
jgi:hypothetical protein